MIGKPYTEHIKHRGFLWPDKCGNYKTVICLPFRCLMDLPEKEKYVQDNIKTNSGRMTLNYMISTGNYCSCCPASDPLSIEEIYTPVEQLKKHDELISLNMNSTKKLYDERKSSLGKQLKINFLTSKVHMVSKMLPIHGQGIQYMKCAT